MKFDFILTDGETTVDMSMLKDLAGDIAVIIKPIIEVFLTNIPETIEKMKRYYALEDWDNLYKTAHYIKSSVSVIKIDKIYEAVMDIELKTLNRVELDSIKLILNYIEKQYGIAERLLRKELMNIS